VLPVEARELPEQLVRIDELLRDPKLLRPIERHWEQEARQRGRSARAHGRPMIPIPTYVRPMVVKQRSDRGYETLVKEVSDSLHLRRFCLVPLHGRFPTSRGAQADPQTGARDGLRAHPLGDRKRGPRAPLRARAARIDSTVVETDVCYPSDAVLCLQGAWELARSGKRLARRIGARSNAVRNRSGAIGRRVRQISRTLAREARRRADLGNGQGADQAAG
jgi:transposase, IS5 family